MVVATLFLAAPSAVAQPTHLCMPRDRLALALLGSYNEESVAGGISVDGTLLEVFASPDGSFTVVKTAPRGHACIVDGGVGWQMKGRDAGKEKSAGPAVGRPDL